MAGPYHDGFLSRLVTMPVPMSPDVLLLWSLVAAHAAGLGTLLGRWPWFAKNAVGWATAAAAGLMLGIGYVLLDTGQHLAPAPTLFGALVGLGLVRLADGGVAAQGVADDAHAANGTTRLSSPPATDAGEILASALHSAVEGIAIGAAAASGVPLAQFLLITFGFHNISEGAVLGTLLAERGMKRSAAMGVAILARTSQPLVGVSTLFLIGAVPALLPWLIGASFGSLLYLIIAELLPQSYRLAGRTAIAVVVSLAAGMVALMGRP